MIEKLNKIIEYMLDKGTQNTMLAEPWTDNFAGGLAECTKMEHGRCTPTFSSQFEAQYYCEALGDECIGVSGSYGEFTTMKQIVEKSQKKGTSSVKGTG